jgi:hypothetical protein
VASPLPLGPQPGSRRAAPPQPPRQDQPVPSGVGAPVDPDGDPR